MVVGLVEWGPRSSAESDTQSCCTGRTPFNGLASGAVTAVPRYFSAASLAMPAALRAMGLLAVGMALVIGLAWAAVVTVSDSRLNARVEVPRETIVVPTDITAIQRGQHLASAVAACVDCHGA